MLCAECTAFKQDFESLDEDNPDTERQPFQNFGALEKSASLGCVLCHIIYETWKGENYSETYKKDFLINVVGYANKLMSRTQGIYISYEGSYTGFTLADVTNDGLSEEQFRQYQIARRQIIDPNTTDGIDRIASLASKWIRTCRQTHRNCRSYSDKRETKVLPTRLIDVGTKAVSQAPRLFIPTRHLPSFEYIALSYAWGSSNFTKTTSSNLQAMIQQLPWTELPKTIQDAIIVTRSLGVRYLWVDALCILQSEGPDDIKHKEDWSYEAARFGKYYENALLTIAATGASSSDQGLFLPRSGPKSLTFRPGTPIGYTIRSRISSWHHGTTTAPLSKRGWAIQERLLSRRVLHFAENMILWECHDCRATELDPQGLIPIGPDDIPDISSEFMTKCRDLYAKGPGSDNFMDEWYQFIPAYTKSDFTFVSDRLPAVSGIATIIQKHSQQSYVAGLWESDIPRGLAWQSFTPFRFETAHLIDPRIINNPAKGESQLVFPSWSWASSRGFAFYDPGLNWTPFVTVESWEVDFKGADTSGQIRGARLTLRGILAMLNLTDLSFVPEKDSQGNVLGRGPETGFTRLEAVHMDDVLDSQTRRISHPCLIIGIVNLYGAPTGVALILKETGNQLGHIKEYRRIGLMSLPMGECLSIFTDKETTISLV